MPTTRETVETKLYDAILAEWADLGYSSQDAAKVHKYLPEHTASAKLADYYLAQVSGEDRPKVRAWGIDAGARLDFGRIPEQTESVVVTTRVVAWYEIGVAGAGITLLRSHMSVVHQALKALGITLGGAAIRILDWTEPEYLRTSIPVSGVEGEVLRGEFRIVADNPNGTI